MTHAYSDPQNFQWTTLIDSLNLEIRGQTRHHVHLSVGCHVNQDVNHTVRCTITEGHGDFFE